MLVAVGAVQMIATLDDPEGNLDRIGARVGALAADGAQVVVLPEAMNAGYLFDSAQHALASGAAADSPFVAGLAALADEMSVWIACGITERAGDELFNTAVLVGPGTGLAGRHRKVNLAPHDRRWFSRGDGRPAVVDTPFGRLGLFICFDSRLPWVARNLALAGADLLLNCANFFSEDKANLHLRVRAAENGVPIVAASKAGPERAATYQGGTCAIDASGDLIDVLGPQAHDATLLAQVDLDGRRRDERLARRRPEAYAVLSRPWQDTDGGRRESEPVIVADTAVQVAAVQGRWTDPAALEARLTEVATLGAGIWVLPQHPCGDRPTTTAEAGAAADRSGAVLDAVAGACRAAGAWCVLGTVVRDGGGPVAVHAVVDGRGHVRLGRPAHLDPATAWSPAGDEWLTVDTPWGRLGVLGGADITEPESARSLAAHGADLLCVTAAVDLPWVRDLAVLERGAETRCHVVMANRIDCCSAPGGSVMVPLTGFPTSKLVAAGRAGPAATVVTGFVELAAARSKQITTGTHLFEVVPPVLVSAGDGGR